MRFIASKMKKFSCEIFLLLIYWNLQDEELSLRSFLWNRLLMVFWTQNFLPLHQTLMQECKNWFNMRSKNLDPFQTKKISSSLFFIILRNFNNTVQSACNFLIIERSLTSVIQHRLHSIRERKKKNIFFFDFPLLTVFLPSSLVDEK